MRALSLVGALVLGLTSCATGTAPSGGPPRTTAPRAPVHAAYPLTISRVGGIAGFLDVVVVPADGAVLTRTSRREERRCDLTPDFRARLDAALAAVHWPGLAAPTTDRRMSDQMFVQIRTADERAANLSDPGLGAAGGLAQSLLHDVVGDRPAYRLCRAA